VGASFTVPAGQAIAAMIGCGGGGGAAHSSGSTITGGTGGSGFSTGGNGGEQTTAANQSGGGAGGGSTAVCVYGNSGSPCGTLLAVTSGGGGAGAGGCTGNGGSGGNGNAGAVTGASPSSESNPSAPGGASTGQGFGGGGGASDSGKQAAGGGGGGGLGAPSGTANAVTTGGTGAAVNTAGAGGAVLSGGSGPAGSVGSGPDASGNGANGPTAGTANSNHQGGGGGGAGYYGGGSGAANTCTLFPALGSGGGGAGSSWVATSQLTSFTNGTNPSFTAGSATGTACGVHTTQGTSGATNGAGGNGTTASGIASANAGCPGNVTLTWSALPGAPTGVTGVAASGQITGSWTAPTDSGTASITGYTVTATPLPSGSAVSHTFNSTATTETLTGLTNGTSYNFSVAAVTSVGTGPPGNASNNPITVGVAPAITSGASTTFTEQVAGSFTVTSTGAPTAGLSATGALPSGVTFVDNHNGTATLAGTPAPGTAGTYPLTITASNGVGSNATQSFTLTVDSPAHITSADHTTFFELVAGSSFTVTSTGSPTPSVGETGALPTGVTFVDNGNGTATLSGTPASGTGGIYHLTITATNGVGSPATQSFTLTVDSGPAITSINHTTFTENFAGSFTVTSTGVPDAALSETGALPSGVTFVDNGDGTASLSGTPAVGAGGIYHVTITASNGIGTDATQSFTLTVDSPAHITSADHTTFTEQVAGAFTVISTGVPDATVSSTGTLPSGVTFTDNGDGTATLAGTPASGTAGAYPLSITASNGVGLAANQSFTLTVNRPPTITSADNTTLTEQVAGSFTVTSDGSPDAAMSETGALPSGVTFTDNGDGTATLGGTPAVGTAGTYSLTITADNGVGSPAHQSFTLTVNAAPAITSADHATFTTGHAGSFTITTTGAPTPTVSKTGSLPSGLSFVDNGDGTATISGTAATGSTGDYLLTITASNGVGTDATQAFTLTVNSVPIITSAPMATFTVGTMGTFTVHTTGSPYPAITETGDMPNGVSLTDNGNGTATIAGTPADGSAGSYGFFLTANNGVGNPASQGFTLTVSGFEITTSSLLPGTEGSSYKYSLQATGGTTPYAWSLIKGEGPLPKGLKLNKKSGLIHGHIHSPSGTYTFTVRVLDAQRPVADEATKTLAIRVN
jgi:hypothetical protein